MSSVCPSVCPSVRTPVALVDCDHICWNSSKIISLPDSLRFRQTTTSKGTPRNLAGIGEGYRRGFRRTKSRGKKVPQLLLRTSKKLPIRAFDWCQNQRPRVTLRGHCALCLHCLENVDHYYLLIYCIYVVQKMNKQTHRSHKRHIANDSKCAVVYFMAIFYLIRILAD